MDVATILNCTRIYVPILCTRPRLQEVPIHQNPIHMLIKHLEIINFPVFFSWPTCIVDIIHIIQSMIRLRLKVLHKQFATRSTQLPSDWTKLAKKELKGKDPEQTLTWNTPEGIAIQPLYTSDHIKVLFK